MRSSTRIFLACLILITTRLATTTAPAADAPPIRELRTQKVGDTIYFHVAFGSPPNLVVFQPRDLTFGELGGRTDLGRQPRLVPQDNRARAVCTRWETLASAPLPFRPATLTRQPSVTGLEFVGQCAGTGPARFLLLYPTEKTLLERQGERDVTVRKSEWAQLPIVLDFDKAEKLSPPRDGRSRGRGEPVRWNELDRLWALAQATQFALLEAQAPECSFYGFAREAMSRKYEVVAPSLRPQFTLGADASQGHLRLYETTTGAAAIAESLQMERMQGTGARDTAKRTIDIDKVPGIAIAAHPWDEMMKGRRPRPEPLARLVPHDNYFVHFKDIRKYLEMSDLIDRWGTSLLRAYEVHSRDYQLRERYERQLCLRSTALARTVGPLVVRGIALTGSDLYVREGSDVAAVFHVVNKNLFLAAVNPFLAEARAEWGDRLRAGKEDYHGVVIESYVTPLREVSLYRAVVGDFVVYANSPIGVRRILDAQQGRRPCLADAPDYQYMRTVFPADASEEDGFAFLSDPFIRQLVGPASKIKEKRRLEAITSLHIVTNDALFAAWETGKLPASSSSLLRPAETAVPEGKAVTWDGTRRLAVSDVYGSLLFATPLLELPIDRITEVEERQYQQFRAQYLGLWRGYFDPIGIRVSLRDERVKLETFILPLVQTSTYNDLRRSTGGGTTALQPAAIPPGTAVQLLSHISPTAAMRDSVNGSLRDLGALATNASLDWLGDWAVLRLGDSDVYAQLARRLRDREAGSEAERGPLSDLDLLFQMPVTAGVGIKNSLVLAGALTGLRGMAMSAAPDVVTWAPLDPPYKGVSIVRVQAVRQGLIDREVNRGREQPFLPALYYALVDDGWYISPREDCIRAVIDASVARRDGRVARAEPVPVNSSLYVAPSAGAATRDFVGLFLEDQTHRQALGNAPYWYALYRAGLIPAGATEAARARAAFHAFGFVPVSGEGAPYVYEPKTDDIVNGRHGSPRRPERHATLAPTSPLGRMMEEFPSLRADLRFREDGVFTVLTITRKRR